jgi:S1-C subfamily serine protease
MGSYFIAKTDVARADILRDGEEAALNEYDRLRRFLLARVEPETAALLAEPVINRGGATDQVTIAWYGPRAGAGQPLSALDDEARRAAAAILRRRLAALAPLTAEGADGALLAQALNLRDADAVWVVDGDPVLIDWGMLPEPARASPEAAAAHRAATLGAFAPPAAPAAAAAGPAGAAAAWSGAAALGAGGAAPPPVPPGAGAPEGPDRGRGRAVAALAPLAILLALSLATLIWLLWPGTRIFPTAAAPPPRLVESAEAARVLGEVNASLEERVRALREAVEGAVCTDDGTLLLPDGRTPEGLTPPAGGWTADAAEAPAAADPAALAPPAPERVALPAPAGVEAGAEPGTLLQALEAQTVMVLAMGGDGVGTGSGFFVGPDLVVTNHHVVAGALEGGEIYVTNGALAGVRPAQALASRGPLEDTGGDFALLRVEGVAQPAFPLRESTETMKLQNVIAAGYPAAVLETDENFARLREGDATAIPDLVVTDGIVNTEQTLGPGTRAVVHTARISRGNSGGPLVDTCGRVVGVNTFGRTADEVFLNFALSSGDLIGFLREAGVALTTASGGCVPQVRPAQAPPRAASAEGAAGGEAGGPAASAPPAPD